MRKLVPLLVLAMATAGSAQSFSKASVVKVTLADYHFIPPTVQLSAGKPMILRLSNTAGQPHEFAAPEFFKAATIRPADAKFINAEGEAEVLGGHQVDIALVPKAGTYHLQCNKPGHVILGMKGTIVVK
jgi:uncharacterized cupredoxin-like copper-binding protein